MSIHLLDGPKLMLDNLLELAFADTVAVEQDGLSVNSVAIILNRFSRK